MAVVSPIFRRLRLEDYGVEWVAAPLPLAHPLDDGRVAVLSRQMSATVATLGRDGAGWERLLRPFVDRHEDFFSSVLRPQRVPRHPWLMARFGLVGRFARATTLLRRFADAPARALLAGNAAHSFLPLDSTASASFGLVLAVAGHAVDWPWRSRRLSTDASTLWQHARERRGAGSGRMSRCDRRQTSLVEGRALRRDAATACHCFGRSLAVIREPA
jgi:phytoene dehydrogenase-like protein